MCTDYKNCGFFANYECTPMSIRFIMYSVMAMNWIWILQGTTAYLCATVIDIFTDYSLKDFMDAGRWGDYLGCMVKYLPWAVVVLHMIWAVLIVVALILVPVAGICSNRFNKLGVSAVKNCRLYYTSSTSANRPSQCTVEPAEATKNIWNCGSFNYLFDKRFLLMDCELGLAKHICEYYSDLQGEIVGKEFIDAYNGWSARNACTTPRPDYNFSWTPTFQDEGEPPFPTYWHELTKSDLYRYATIWCLWACGFFVAVTVCAAIIRFRSPVESSFYQPKQDEDNCCVACCRAMTPWGGT
eukprot:GHVU01008991.1.p1 GENE.GHVU01008991.1~~GHVU01008991.1.p1  ORF type:complete len:298 (+),score=36.51 GHVU01008991.1:1198-2091(+)